MNRGFLLMAGAAVLAAATGSAAAASCPGADKNEVKLDAAASVGRATLAENGVPPNNEVRLDATASGHKFDCRFGKRDAVTVKVFKRNPFRFTYKLVVDDKPVEEPDLKPIAGMLKPAEAKPGDAPAKGEKPAPKKVEQVGAALQLSPDQRKVLRGFRAREEPLPPETVHQWICADADPEWQLLGSTDTRLDESTGAAKQKVETVRAASGALAGAHAALIALTEGSNPTAETAKTAHDAFVGALNKQSEATAQARGVKGDLEHLARTAAEQTKALGDFRAKHPACASFHDAEWVGYYGRAAFWKEDFAPAYLREIAEHDAALARFEQIRDQVAAILGRPDAFEHSYAVGPFEQPTDVAVELKRTDKKGGDPETIADVDLNFGGRQRFAFTTGLVATEVEKFEFGKQTGLVPKKDKPEEMEKATLVGFKERSDWRTSVMALAHVRVLDWSGPDASVFLTFGATSGGDVFTGASLGLAENRAFLSVGVYGAKIDELEGGLAPGDRLPESFTEDLPVRKAWRWKVGFGLTVKVGG